MTTAMSDSGILVPSQSMNGTTTLMLTSASVDGHHLPHPHPHHALTGGMPPAASGSLFDELKFLSLEATAERYLGSSSGFSFARLTQTVLRRLSPDRADFVFATEPDNTDGPDAAAVGSSTAVTVTSAEPSSVVSESLPGIEGIDAMGISENTPGSASVPPPPSSTTIPAPVDTEKPLFDFASPSEALNSIFHTFENSLTCFPTTFGILPLADLAEPEDVLATVTFPEDAHLNELVAFYFAHSHTLYPMIHQGEFLRTLELIRQTPPSQHTIVIPQHPLAMFRVWMVLAIGASSNCAVTLSEESEPMLYYNKAMSYFEGAFEYGDMAALEVLMLQVSYSFFSQLGPNTWFLIGLAARMAVGMGLHTASTYESIPVDLAERRKKLFFSIYMMDRVASMALGRPFALHDDDIDISPFADADESDILVNGIRPRSGLEPSLMSVPLHILALRRIASKIATQVYSQSTARRVTSPEQRDAIVRNLHRELVEWRRSMPFPLPDMHPRVPHLSSSWYDFNFYSHLAMLYRPSPLYPTLDPVRVRLLAHAAALSIRHAINMHRQQRLAYNWLNLLSVFTAALSLVYAVTAQPDDLPVFLNETRAIEDLEAAAQLFDMLSAKFGAAKKIKRMILQIVGRYRDMCSGAVVVATAHSTA